ncbi:rhodanese-like domain-containing protein [Jiella sp. M17.18]|uniref:rhodanese-like domain-containing protein n=1 Tax=Jiella sp. M17.18 TaxID=3234247 RepID=UPI0034DF60C4
MTSMKDMMDAANAAVPKISAEEAQRLAAEENALILDVREPAEVAATGKAKGALNVPRGMLEFKADPGAASADPAFARDRPVVIYCAAGARAALAGKTLREMGYEKVYNLGGFKDWAEAGGETEPGS